nr:hypothetical protein [Tanacetum cinerariifolium]
MRTTSGSIPALRGKGAAGKGALRIIVTCGLFRVFYVSGNNGRLVVFLGSVDSATSFVACETLVSMLGVAVSAKLLVITTGVTIIFYVSGNNGRLVVFLGYVDSATSFVACETLVSMLGVAVLAKLLVITTGVVGTRCVFCKL